jgi:hypothetical protein
MSWIVGEIKNVLFRKPERSSLVNNLFSRVIVMQFNVIGTMECLL